MRFTAPPISHHRLTRFHRWAMLWLKWFAAFLETAAAFAPLSRAVEEQGHRWLDKIEHIIVCIVALRATPHMVRGPPRRRVLAHPLRGHACRRAFVGSRMRRALRSKCLRQRIQKLRQDIGGLVARVLRRLPRGLTRRRPILARPEARRADAPSVFSLAAVCADTS